MRLLLAGPPKTGNVWLENILAHVYGLTILKPPDVPATRDSDFEEFCGSGRFIDGSIFHQHFAPTERFFEIAESVNCRLLTAIRNPYDTFVSLYFYIQNFREDFIKAGDPGVAIINRPIDDPVVMDFLMHGFRPNLERARAWLRAERSIIVRYEDLHVDPFGETKRITNMIRPVSDDPIRDAIEASDASVLRKQNAGLAKHIRKAAVGDWRNHLNDQHLAIFRETHGDLIKSLGYTVIGDVERRRHNL